MSPLRAVPAVLALLALSAAPSYAQHVEGDDGQAPTTAAECRAKVKAVDADLKWENDRWAKLSGKKLALRAKFAKRVRTLTARNVELQPQVDAITAAMEAGRQSDPPMSDDELLALDNQRITLMNEQSGNDQKIEGLEYQIEDIDAELKRLKKLHVSNVRNTVKYRKQVVDYCQSHF